METLTYLDGAITVERHDKNRWVAKLNNGIWVWSSCSATDAVGQLIETYPNAVIETILLRSSS